MSGFVEIFTKSLAEYPLITAFVFVGAAMWLSYAASKKLTAGRVHGSAIAIVLGLVLAYIGGKYTGGKKGIADVQMLSGIALMGGAVLRDFAIVSTAFGVRLEELKKVGVPGAVALVVSVVVAIAIGAATSYAFGYTDPVSMATIGGGAATFIVGPVTGAALGASSEVIALSIAAGVVKSIAVMILTPLVAKRVGLTTPGAAAVYGGIMGTTSGTAAGLAATDPKLVPYGALTATFYTGFGCLVCPSIGYLVLNAMFG
ncbi:malonate transporter, MadM subunit [Rhodospirillum rubrum F11]|uniref:Malonate/sodium symporter MadM subunit n=1 Tax=Rhodospirillum rubrum (strain ATCC 11170 / ATH 1.1.1 / DSM 467 / LMG 4362 / NCIMB 8255 / S1) TaxID=269796 RepID=Q2RUR4_RHORT|nr:malonate transporter subunit MadM [Rhodospirillum rubrum]ABC22131.1 Malonate/sodium symporter MadM subunit [Rhodospirillum rubrum ATCC 11170]AEO47846.1 malonate transporter, MadM subunit [Rhodospirillum rubrum F11]MBK5953720.1 malonate transporter subunit MadM [Rhodospirillum rubrum]QXG81780.1 malonate transporter subunit MadM [Rhodospirillum rubrum]